MLYFPAMGIQIGVPGSHVDCGPTDEKVTDGGTCPPQGVQGSWGLTPANSCQARTSFSFSRAAGKSGSFSMKFLFENVEKSLKLKEKSTVFVKQHVHGQVSPVSSQFGTLDSGCSNSKLCSLNVKGSR